MTAQKNKDIREVFASKYRRSFGHMTVKDWCKEVDWPLTDEVANATLGQRSIYPSVRVQFFLSAALGFTNDEAIAQLKAELGKDKDKDKEIKYYLKRMAPADIGTDERDLIEKLRSVKKQDPAKYKIIMDLMKL